MVRSSVFSSTFHLYLCCNIVAAKAYVFVRESDEQKTRQIPVEISVKGGTASQASTSSRQPGLKNEIDSSALAKRVKSKSYTNAPTQIDQLKCPPGHTFMYSWCHYGESPQAWTLACRAPLVGARPTFEQTQIITYGTCPNKMLCIDGTEFPDRAGQGYEKATATCFDGEYFVQLSQNIAETVQPGSTVVTGGTVLDQNKPPTSEQPNREPTTLTGVGPPRGAHVALEALLTSDDHHTTVEAAHMEMWAQTRSKIGSYDAWRAVARGHASCDNCSSLAIWDVAPTTQRVRIDVELPVQAKTAQLFFFNGAAS